MTRRLALSVLVTGLLAGQAHAINILTIGDSITYGYEAPGAGADVYGYQTTLAGLMPNANFIGEFTDFHAFSSVPWDAGLNIPGTGDFMGTYGKHFGLPGATIQTITSTMQNVPVTTGTAGSPQPYTPSGQTLAQRLVEQPDVIILHAGTNNLQSSGNPINAITQPQLDTLKAAYRTLLGEVAAQFPNARVMISLIIPKASQFAPGFPGNTQTIRNNIYAYNMTLLSLLDEIATPGDDLHDSFAGNLAHVDLFTLDVASLDLPAPLLAAAQKDGDPYVDWLTSDTENLLAPNTAQSFNTSLFGDNVHPNLNGYGVMGHAFYQGLINAGFIPEPGTIAVLLGGGMMMLRRRA